MGNELSKHIEHAQKSGVLQLRNFKLNKVYFKLVNNEKKLRIFNS